MTDITINRTVNSAGNYVGIYEDLGASTLASVTAAEALQVDSDGYELIIDMNCFSHCSILSINSHATATMDIEVYKTTAENPTFTLAAATGNDSVWESTGTATTVAAHGQDYIEYIKGTDGLARWLMVTGLNSTAGALAIAEFIIRCEE